MDPQAEIIYGDTKIILQAESSKVYVNGVTETLSVSIGERNGRLFVPLRFISEHFGAQVDYKNHTIDIHTKRSHPGLERGSNDVSMNAYAGGFVEKGDYDYFVSYENGLYNVKKKSKKDASELVIMSNEGGIYNLNVVGKDLYYHNDGKLIKYNMENSQSLQLVSNASKIYVVGDTVYYIDQSDLKLVKMKNDGNKKQEIGSNVVNYMVIGQTIYYTDHGNKTFKVGLDSNGGQKIFQDMCAYGNGYFYYVSRGYEGGSERLARQKEDGSGKTFLQSLDAGNLFKSVKVLGNWIYYTVDVETQVKHDSGNFSTTYYSGSLYRVSFDGQQHERLTQGKTGSFYLYKNGVYYENLITQKWVFQHLL